MEDIIFETNKQKLINHVTELWNKEVKKKPLPSILKKFHAQLNNYYSQQLRILEYERDRPPPTTIPTPTTTFTNTTANVIKKKACLVGINYTGTNSELRGCVNDVYILRDLLVSQYNYKVEDIRVLTDERATRQNILNEFTSLVQQAKSGDSICFTFSGHGSYVNDRNNEEADGRDELIVTVDNYAITDDELKSILDRYLNPEVNMFSIFDSCHSGTILDLKYSFDNNTTSVINEAYRETKGNVILLSGCRDDQVSMDAYINKSFNGALSSAFVLTMRNNPSLTWNELLVKMKEVLLSNKMTQVPQISAGKSLNMSDLQVKI